MKAEPARGVAGSEAGDRAITPSLIVGEEPLSLAELVEAFNATVVDLPEELQQETFVRAWNDAQPVVDFKSMRTEPRWTGAPYARRRPTSQGASITAAEGKRNRQRAVLDVIKRLGPISDDGIAAHLGVDTNSVRPRRLELARAGHIEEAGRTRTRSGHSAVAWRVVA